jgi:hypothetical protein
MLFLITLVPNPTTAMNPSDSTNNAPPMDINEAVPIAALSNMMLNASAEQQPPLSEALFAKMSPQALIQIFHSQQLKKEKQQNEDDGLSTRASSDNESFNDEESSDDECPSNDESSSDDSTEN